MAAVASISYRWVYLAYSVCQNDLTIGSVILETTFSLNSGSANILLMPSSVESGYSKSAKIELFKMYSILADQTSGQTFLKTPINPPATKCLYRKSTFSMTLKAIG